MTPHRDKNGGATFYLDRRVPGVGRIKRASGTTHAPTFRRLNEMIDGLRETGRLDLLRAIKGGRLTPLEVWDAYRVGQLARLPDAEQLAGLRAAMDAWLAGVDASANHRSTLKSSVAHLARAAGAGATVGDLPRALRALRETMRATPRAFNYCRSAAQAFARDTAGRHSRLWLEVSGVEPLRVRARRKTRPVTPPELVVIARALDRLHPGAGATAWALALTGMRPGSEYWGKSRKGAPAVKGPWEDRGDRIHVEGTKTEAAVRDIPRVAAVAPPACWEGKFGRLLREATGGAVQPYDLRRSFASWMEAAGVPRTRRRLYLGHAAGDVTDLYERHEVEAYLAADARVLAAYVEREAAKAPPEEPPEVPDSRGGPTESPTVPP